MMKLVTLVRHTYAASRVCRNWYYYSAFSMRNLRTYIKRDCMTCWMKRMLVLCLLFMNVVFLLESSHTNIYIKQLFISKACIYIAASTQTLLIDTDTNPVILTWFYTIKIQGCLSWKAVLGHRKCICISSLILSNYIQPTLKVHEQPFNWLSLQ
jgi:hypothetical protein